MSSTRVRSLEPGDSADRSLSPSEVHTVLSNDRRRYALHYLLREGRSSLRELGRQVAAWENEIDLGEVSSKQRRRAHTALHQTHLPKLDEVGIVNYLAGRSVVELGEKADEIRVYMEVLEGDEIPWSDFYLGLAGLGGAVVLARSVGVVPFDALGWPVWASCIVLAFAAASVVHAARTRERRLGSDGDPPTLG